MFDFFKKSNNEQTGEKKSSFWNFSFEGLKNTISNTAQNLVQNVCLKLWTEK